MKTKAEEWAELVDAWRTSGQTARVFARERGVAESSLRWWSGRISRGTAQAPRTTLTRRAGALLRPSPSFAKVVRPGEAPPEAGPITVVVGRCHVCVEHGFDGSLLRQVIRALAEAL